MLVDAKGPHHAAVKRMREAEVAVEQANPQSSEVFAAGVRVRLQGLWRSDQHLNRAVGIVLGSTACGGGYVVRLLMTQQQEQEQRLQQGFEEAVVASPNQSALNAMVLVNVRSQHLVLAPEEDPTTLAMQRCLLQVAFFFHLSHSNKSKHQSKQTQPPTTILTTTAAGSSNSPKQTH